MGFTRISAASQARLLNDTGQFCLIVNKGRLGRGVRILSPIGGGIHLKDNGRIHLKGLGATDFEKGIDLKCVVPDENLPDAIAWFRDCADREHGVLRELYEELGDESGTLTARDLRSFSQTFTNFRTDFEADTPRKVTHRKTRYLLDMFDVKPSDAVMEKLLAAAKLPLEKRWVYWATAAEIKKGETKKDKVKIGPISKCLLWDKSDGVAPHE
jgi:hypothetical protein